ncbi:MAG: phosphotransferase [Dehalococcoidia bacterium]
MDEATASTPYRPEDVTTSWLTDQLRREGVLSSGLVANFTVDEMTPGQGRAAHVTRLTLEYDGVTDDAPATLIAKFPTTFHTTRNLARLFHLYHREYGFYTDVADNAGPPTPHLYGASLDERTGDFVLLLEDISPAKEGDLATGCSLEQAATVVDTLARMHARWWDSPELTQLSWLPLPNYVTNLEYEGADARDPWSKFLAQTGDRLPAPLLSLCRKLRRDQSVLERLATPPLTLVHGDLNIQNVMFSPDPDHEIRALIDWQTAVRGRGPMDIASLFASSLDPADRRTAEAELLPAYHQILTDNGVRGYSFDECWRDYRLAIVNRFSQIVFLSSVLETENKVEDHVGAVTGLRLAAALIELDVTSLIPSQSLWESSLARIRGAIRA